MLAVGGELPSDDAPWAYEMKWDGIRALAHIDTGKVMLVSRTGRDVSASYPELQGLASAWRSGGPSSRASTAAAHGPLVLDGEIVAFGPDGWPSFEVLQQRMNVSSPSQVRQLAAEVSVSYLAFDLLSAGGESLLDRPYRTRRQRLDDLGLEGPHWQTPAAFVGVSGADIRAVSQQHRLEGIMAKRLESRYEPGKRSSAWRKIKNIFRQEVVVGGWKPGEGMRASLLGSLIVGVYDARGDKHSGLVYAGHVGTGFTNETLQLLTAKLAPLRRATSPFGSTIPVPPEHARSAVWVEPELVIEVAFALWTSSGRLRAAAYQGLRTDKDPTDVVREQ
jgi:bifunctional non-homologous end joining protein LigD